MSPYVWPPVYLFGFSYFAYIEWTTILLFWSNLNQSNREVSCTVVLPLMVIVLFFVSLFYVSETSSTVSVAESMGPLFPSTATARQSEPGPNVINSNCCSIVTLYWTIPLWLVNNSHLTCKIQTECFIPAYHSYIELKFVILVIWRIICSILILQNVIKNMAQKLAFLRNL